MISRKIRELFDKHTAEASNGLYLLEILTGGGKTYSAYNAIAQYAKEWAEKEASHDKDASNYQQVIFTTILKKNLKTDVVSEEAEGVEIEEIKGELRKRYEELGRGDKFEEEVLFVDSLADTAINAVQSIRKIRDSGGDVGNFKTYADCSEWSCLEGVVVQYQNVKNSLKFIDPQSQIFINNDYNRRLRAAYDNFRRHIRYHYAYEHKIAKVAEVNLESIAKEEGFEWLPVLFPDLKMRSSKVLLMSFNKLCEGKLQERPKSYITGSFIDNKILIVDEFDSSKNALKKTLIGDNPDDFKIDFMDMARKIFRGFENPSLSSIYYEIEKNIRVKKLKINYIEKKLNRFVAKYHLENVYKSIGSLAEKKNNYIFEDRSTIVVTKDNKNHPIVCQYSDNERRVNISRDKKDFLVTEDSFIIPYVIKDVYYLLSLFARHSYEMARVFKEMMEDKLDISIEESFNSYLRHFGIKGGADFNANERDFLFKLADAKRLTYKGNKEWKSGVYDYYSDGFRYILLEDDNNHVDNTVLGMVDFPKSPEIVLSDLCSRCLVLGMSATATVETVTHNYNLKWLKENIKNYHDMVREDEELSGYIADFIKRRYNAYRDGRIQFDIVVVPDYDNMETEDLIDPDIVFKHVGTAKIRRDMHKCLMDSTGFSVDEKTNDYYFKRYLALLFVLYNFASRRNIQSILIMENRIFTNSEFDRDKSVVILKKMLEYINKELCLGDDSIDVRTLYSSNFNQEWGKIRKDLEDNNTPKRIAILSTYSSIGTGQDLAYKIPDKYKGTTVCIDRRYDGEDVSVKDLDGLYFCNQTNLAVNLNDIIDQKKLMELIIQTEELCENMEISPEMMYGAIKTGFKLHRIERAKDIRHLSMRNPAYDTPSIKAAMSLRLCQSIGRLDRTSVRNLNPVLYIDEKALSSLNKEVFEKLYTNPMIDLVVDRLNNVVKADVDSKGKHLLFKALLVYEKAHHYYYNNLKIATGNADESDETILRAIDEREEMKMFLLKHPTLNDEQYNRHESWQGAFFDCGDDLSQYLYSHGQNDYRMKSIRVFLGTDEKEFASLTGYYAPFDKDHIYRVSEEASDLPRIFKYPGMKDEWERMGFCTKWEKNRYIMSPLHFVQLYKGGIGEYAGKFILEKELGMELEALPLQIYEKADFRIKGTDLYIDFKNFKGFTLEHNDKEREHYKRKAKEIGAKRYYIINLLKQKDKDFYNDGLLVEIPWLIDDNGRVNKKIYDILMYKE